MYDKIALSWIFGSLLLLIGIATFFTYPLPAITILAISSLILPPVRKFAYVKFGKKLTYQTRLFSILALFLLTGLFFMVGESPEKIDHKLDTQKTNISQQNIDYFHANHQEILLDIRNAIEKKEYDVAIAIAGSYLATNDAELSGLYGKAKVLRANLIKKTTTDNILSDLKKIPEQDYERNMELYGQLVRMYPDNEKYRKKYGYYSNKMRELKQKQRLAATRKESLKSQFSAWDGSHIKLEQFIKNSMNDPDSYKHVETVYWDMGDYLVVRTTFRGKNAFGGVVKNAVKARVDLSGNVLEILDQY